MRKVFAGGFICVAMIVIVNTAETQGQAGGGKVILPPDGMVAKGGQACSGSQWLSVAQYKLTGLPTDRIVKERWYIEADSTGENAVKVYDENLPVGERGVAFVDFIGATDGAPITIPACVGPPTGGWSVRCVVVSLEFGGEVIRFDTGFFHVKCD